MRRAENFSAAIADKCTKKEICKQFTFFLQLLGCGDNLQNRNCIQTIFKEMSLFVLEKKIICDVDVLCCFYISSLLTEISHSIITFTMVSRRINLLQLCNPNIALKRIRIDVQPNNRLNQIFWHLRRYFNIICICKSYIKHSVSLY